MREWDGIHNDMAPVGDGPFQNIQNVTFRTDGQIERRTALTNRIPVNLTVLRMSAHETTGVGSWIIAATSAAISGINLTSGAVTSLLTGLTNSTYYPSFSFLNATTYINNGVDAMRYVARGDTAGGTAGLAGPGSAPTAVASAGGGMTVGTHLIRYRWYNATRNTYSDPSPALSFTIATGNQTLTLTTPSPPAGSSLIVEVTAASGTEYYQCPTGATITQSDQVLSVGTAANSYAGPDGFGFEVPPICRLSCVHRGRIFLWAPTSGTTQDLLYWSRFGFPEAFRANVWARSGTLAFGDVPTAIMSFQEDLYLVGQRSMTRLIYTLDPADGILSPIPTTHGAYNQYCVIGVDSAIYGFGRNGAWRITGIMPKHISDPVDDTVWADIDYTQSKDFFVSWDHLERAVRFHYSTTSGRGKKAAVYHVDKDRWSVDTFLNEISHAVEAAPASGNSALYAMDGITYAGDLWNFKLAKVGDGLGSGLTNGAFTATAGSTSSVANITPATTASALIGAYLYRPSTGESRRISANATGSITVGTAFSTAITTGEEVYAGSIDVRATPFWMTLQGPKISRARPSYCMVEHVGTGTIPEYRVEFYLDWSSSPYQLTKNATDTLPDGVIIPGLTSSYALVTPVNGVSAMPVPSEWNRVIRWDLRQLKPAGQIAVLDMRWAVDSKGTTAERSQA